MLTVDSSKLKVKERRAEKDIRRRRYFLLPFPALTLRLRSGRAGWANFWRASGAAEAPI
jgi:hypothetical protein